MSFDEVVDLALPMPFIGAVDAEQCPVMPVDRSVPLQPLVAGRS
jgi:hypothetical protein